MSKQRSNKNWIRNHIQDPYVKLANQAGYRSRAAYKLLEINERDHLLQPELNVVELGAAPGGWTQVLAQHIDQGQIIAVDLLPMDNVEGVDFIQGDFRDDEVLEQIKSQLNSTVGLVISDMSPNITGIKAVDQPASLHLMELAADFARQVLDEGGDFLVKAFQGSGFEQFVRDLRENFDKVLIRKPKSSRSRSSEMYIVGKGFKAMQA